MNDYLEAEYGLQMIHDIFKGDLGDGFRRKCEELKTGLGNWIVDAFSEYGESLKSGCYAFCVSEHNNCEDPIGRLSMWRAYGGPDRVAIVFRNEPFTRQNDALMVTALPVQYLYRDDYERHFRSFVENIARHQIWLGGVELQMLASWLLGALLAEVVSIKHPGFEEEKEWRVVYWPKLAPSSYVSQEIASIGGSPQLIHKIPLKKIPDKGLNVIEIDQVLDRIIIGPTTFPDALREALIYELEKVGVGEAGNRVVVSDIPLR